MVGRGHHIENFLKNRYRKAGYSVSVRKKYKIGEIDLLANKGKEKLLIEVKSGRQTINRTDIMKIISKANKLKRKPVLRIGPNVKLTKSAREMIKNYNVRLRRYKYP